MAKPLIIVISKINRYIIFAILSAAHAASVMAQDDLATGEPEVPISTEGSESTENDSEATSEGIMEAANRPEPKQKEAPDVRGEQRRLLQEQYPERELVSLRASDGEFTALWKKDQSGEALGAVLLVPSSGQTANWPNTIDVLRNELPKNGWSTLSIDVAHLPTQAVPKAQRDQNSPLETGKVSGTTENTGINAAEVETKSPESKEPQTDVTQQNLDRIEAAIAFLNEQGQYNIVLAGYGLSCNLIVEYATQADALGMRRSVNSSQTANQKRPVRGLILISPLSSEGERLSEKISEFPYKDMPILDVIFGAHFLDTFDSKERLKNARAARIENYLQTKSIEPTASGKVFGTDNRLSRRVRGFLDTHAKGVEIERR